MKRLAMLKSPTRPLSFAEFLFRVSVSSPAKMGVSSVKSPDRSPEPLNVTVSLPNVSEPVVVFVVYLKCLVENGLAEFGMGQNDSGFALPDHRLWTAAYPIWVKVVPNVLICEDYPVN